MDVGSVQQAVQDGNRRFGAALARKSYAELAALYTEGAKVLPPDAQIVSGRKAIEAYWEKAATSIGLVAATLTTMDLEVAGDTACEVGEAELKLSSGRTPRVKYVVIWRRGDDGNWRLHRDIWNSLPGK